MADWISRLGRALLRPRVALAVFVVAFAAVLSIHFGWRREAQVIAPEPLADIPGIPLDGERSVGSAQVFDNLTVFPIYAKQPDDEWEFTTLERAMAKGEAEVRELGATPTPSPSAAPDAPPSQGAQGNARVGTLEIENKGAVPIMVLAGTILRGGNQDRQVGEDLVVAPHATIAFAAFCVERGRWNDNREGRPTAGKFTVEKTLATGAVRAAGQYEGDQGAVWNKVAAVNAANHKDAPSGTLLATIGDGDLSARRQELADKAASALGAAPQPDRVVGIAYAIDGAVRGVRWFAGKKLLALHLDTLLQTAALEALTAQAEAKAAGRPIAATPAAAESATAFVKEMEAAGVDEKREGKGHTKAYKKGERGYASELVLEPPPPSPTAAGSPKAKATATAPVTKDFFVK